MSTLAETMPTDTALITVASSGIGAALAAFLAASGHRLGLVARRCCGASAGCCLEA